MLRKLTFVLSLVAALMPLGASAQQTIPKGINLHNGYIEIHNNVRVDNRGAIIDPAIRLTTSDWLFGKPHMIEVPAGSVGFFNPCCTAAGTRYIFDGVFLGTYPHFYVTPRLCNVRGIPFGYALVTLSGDFKRDNSNYWIGQMTPKVEDAPCPVDSP